jgi:leucyl/phenylalanyl-tRNA--protein transferase
MAIGLTPDLLLRAYAAGIFPMAESADDPELFWVDPVQRGILPLTQFHLPRRLGRTVRSDRFSVVCDRDFAGVMQGCAEPAADREQTWINSEILAVYTALHAQGHAHSVEAYLDGQLVGGLYGVSLGGAFFGESMFSRVTDASKVALAHLIARLLQGGYRLLDTQFVTDHLKRFGAFEISRAQYRRLLADALVTRAYFPVGPLDGAAVASVLQSSTLIS